MPRYKSRAALPTPNATAGVRRNVPYPVFRKRGPRAKNPYTPPWGVKKRAGLEFFPIPRHRPNYKDQYMLRTPTIAELEELQAAALLGGSLPGQGLSGGIRPGPRAQIYGVEEPGLIDRYRRSMREAENARAPGLAPQTADAGAQTDAQAEADQAAAEAVAEGPEGGRVPIKTEPADAARELFATPQKTPAKQFGEVGQLEATPYSKLKTKDIEKATLIRHADGSYRVILRKKDGETYPLDARVETIRGQTVVSVEVPGPRGGQGGGGTAHFAGVPDWVLQPQTPNAMVGTLGEIVTDGRDQEPLEPPVAEIASGIKPEDLGTRSYGGIAREGKPLPPTSDSRRLTVESSGPDTVVIRASSTGTVLADAATKAQANVLYGVYAILVSPLDMDRAARAVALRAFQELEALQKGPQVLIAPGYESDAFLQRIAKRLRRATSKSYLSRAPHQGFLVYKPGGNQVLAAVPAGKSKLEMANDAIRVRKNERMTPRDILREVRTQQFADSIRQMRLGVPHTEDAAVRQQFAGGMQSASLLQDYRDSRSSDRQRYLRGR